MVLCGRPDTIEFSIVPSESLGLLFGRDLIETMGGIVDTNRRELRIGSGISPLHDSFAGHYAVDLQPANWKMLKDSETYHHIDDDLPKPHVTYYQETPTKATGSQTKSIWKGSANVGHIVLDSELL